MKHFSWFFLHCSFAVVATLAATNAGCIHYVDPASRNTGDDLAAYSRAESLLAEQRLLNALLADQTFAQHYAAKREKKSGASPVLQVAPIDNLSTQRVASLAAIRCDLETALRTSGRFVLSGDPDACDYILKGEYRCIPDGRRVTHKLTLRLKDTAADLDVWTGSDEIAKE